MTQTETGAETVIGIHAIYPSLPYSLGDVGDHFVAIEATWQACSRVARQYERAAGREAAARDASSIPPRIGELSRPRTSSSFRHSLHLEQWEQAFIDGVERGRTERQQEQHEPHSRPRSQSEQRSAGLGIGNLRIESPMDLTLVAQGGAAAGASVCAVYLLTRILSDPERVGAWLPRLVAGWYKGLREVDAAKHPERLILEERAVTDLLELSEQLKRTRLRPTEVTALGVDDPPPDLVHPPSLPPG